MAQDLENIRVKEDLPSTNHLSTYLIMLERYHY